MRSLSEWFTDTRRANRAGKIKGLQTRREQINDRTYKSNKDRKEIEKLDVRIAKLQEFQKIDSERNQRQQASVVKNTYKQTDINANVNVNGYQSVKGSSTNKTQNIDNRQLTARNKYRRKIS